MTALSFLARRRPKNSNATGATLKSLLVPLRSKSSGKSDHSNFALRVCGSPKFSNYKQRDLSPEAIQRSWEEIDFFREEIRKREAYVVNELESRRRERMVIEQEKQRIDDNRKFVRMLRKVIDDPSQLQSEGVDTNQGGKTRRNELLRVRSTDSL